jgi:hypothetical protein
VEIDVSEALNAIIHSQDATIERLTKENAAAWDKCEERRLEGHAWFMELAKAREALTHYENGLQILASTFYKDDQHQDFVRHILASAPSKRAALSPKPESGD